MNIFYILALLTTLGYYSLAASVERIQKKTCKPGTTWKEECHSCYCTEDSKIACSKEACPPQLVPRSRRWIKRTNCIEGETWKEDCHSCFCSLGKPACTRELCESEATYTVAWPSTENDQETTTPIAKCEPGKIWKEDCHTCHCNHNGEAACSRELCISEGNVHEEEKKSKRDVVSTESDEEDEKCPPNVKEWKEDCNDCYCGDDGLKVCSKVLCPDQGPVVAIKPKE